MTLAVGEADRTDMSSRPLLITRIIGGALAGIGLLGGALAVVAADGPGMSPTTMALVILGAVLAWAVDGWWLSVAIVRLLGLDGSDGDEGGYGWDGPDPAPIRPSPPDEEPEWWPEFERELRVVIERELPRVGA
jgi:hypothetical protein